MPKTLKLLVAAVAMSLMATSAHAVTFHTDPSVNTDPFLGLLDFGEVVIGDTKTIRWEISWTLGAGEQLNKLMSPFFSFGDKNGYQVKYVSGESNNCLAQGGPTGTNGSCVFDLLFTPSETGKLEGNGLVQLNLYVVPFLSEDDDGHRYYSLNTTGEGINPVPLPAALSLLGGALSLLGFFGWRRKRMAAA